MAYNLQPLITILQQILNPEQKQWILDDHNKPQLESLLQKSVSLKQIHEKSLLPKVESLESQIRDAAHKAEDIIESNMVDQVLCSRPGGVRFTFSTAVDDLQKVMQELDSVMEQVVKLMAEHNISSTVSSSSSGASLSADHPLSGGASSSADSTSKSFVVGVDKDLLQLKDRLTGMQSKREIVPIVGMGGIGKTTLARKLYEDPLIVDHFKYRAWITISQDYNVRSILLGLLGCIIGKLSDELIGQKDHQLKDKLRKELYCGRYLIVLDDMWSTDSWNDISRHFPDCNNGSRIVITTRESDVAKDAGGSLSLQHQMQFLNKDNSWNLLHQTVFGKETKCADALKEIGRKIAGDCRGLPLAINVIGGLLAKAERSRDSWELISKDVRAAIAETGDQFSNILSLSYNHLPNHLRPCFLYMGAFPEDCEIKASRLIRLWVAEGFLKENGDKSLEEEKAEDYLKALVERNLVLVTRSKCNGKAKSYGIHDLLRDLCTRKANEEKFLHVKNGRVQKETLCRQRRVSAHSSYRMREMYASAEFMSLARSFICTGLMSRVILSPMFFAMRLLRVLDVFEMPFPEFPLEILQLVNLRYLALFCSSDNLLPSEISRLWNLQTFIVRLGGALSYVDLPSEIWEMSELRHLELKDTVIGIAGGYRKTFVQEKLQTISTVYLGCLIRSGFLGCIPHMKSLGIKCLDLPSSAVDLRHLHKLETLKCSSGLWRKEAQSFVATLVFPSSLRKLSLRECAISQKLLTTLCALPNLEELKLHKCVFDDEEWDAATEGDAFTSLQFLLLESLNLVRWRADETNFPRLRQLVIRGCSELEEIPGDIGEIPTLQLIELYKCSPSAEASAKQIQEQQQTDCENYNLQLRIS